jgi:hypothetical protein
MSKLSEWIDFTEGEMDLKSMERLALLLKHSIADQLILDNLRRLRKIVKKSDPMTDQKSVLNEPEFLNQFHEKVMRSIRDLEAQKTDEQTTLHFAVDGPSAPRNVSREV